MGLLAMRTVWAVEFGLVVNIVFNAFWCRLGSSPDRNRLIIGDAY